jgi:dTDP-4-amino-4,6-dideoxy-D-galactose acyltransferase
MTAPSSDPAAARRALELARRSGVALVYWQADPGQPAPEALLAEFAGRLVDRKATYRADLSAADRGPAPVEGGGVRVGEYPAGPASAGLRSLALAAGEYSRFRADPDIPRGKFASLYATWIERSARRELADVVLVAEDDRPGPPLGMVTVAAEGAAAEVGLIAVAGGERRRGVGRLLMQAAHRWMTGRGCSRSAVVTQLANAPACRLYERCGYRLQGVAHCFHFWPQKGRRVDGGR